MGAADVAVLAAVGLGAWYIFFRKPAADGQAYFPEGSGGYGSATPSSPPLPNPGSPDHVPQVQEGTTPPLDDYVARNPVGNQPLPPPPGAIPGGLSGQTAQQWANTLTRSGRAGGVTVAPEGRGNSSVTRAPILSDPASNSGGFFGFINQTLSNAARTVGSIAPPTDAYGNYRTAVGTYNRSQIENFLTHRGYDQGYFPTIGAEIDAFNRLRTEADAQRAANQARAATQRATAQARATARRGGH